ncbi:MAG: hypothetical protein LBJ89_03280 [Holosporales bacterium]|jgi:hypothetical protein|nr:hypothetical protein [Holosporales bacterium]
MLYKSSIFRKYLIMYGIDFRRRVIAHYKANGSMDETAKLFDVDRRKRQMFPNNRDTGPARPVRNISAKIWNNSALGYKHTITSVQVLPRG